MKKKLLAGLATGLLVAGMASVSQATLLTIGTATYGGSDYNLIYDNDNNGNSVVWLDYTNSYINWSTQTSWAADLDSSLTYNIDSAYTVTWEDTAWRLPDTVDSAYSWGYDGTTATGYNITSSEMGHLFYDELGNKGAFDTSGSFQPDYGLINTGDFDNLFACGYWSGTEYGAPSSYAWIFNMFTGYQGGSIKHESGGGDYGLAIRSGQVSAADPVPEPATMLLFGTGIAGLAGFNRRRKGIRASSSPTVLTQ